MVQKRVSDNMKRRIPAPGVKKSTSEVQTSEVNKAVAPKPRPNTPSAPRRPAPPRPPAPKKKVGVVKASEPETQAIVKEDPKPKPTAKATPRPSQEITPITTSEPRHDTPSEPRPTISQPPTEAKAIAYPQMRELTIEERLALHKEINRNKAIGYALPIIKRSELPKHMVMRKKEAELRKLITKKPTVRGVKVYYCPYCVDYMPFPPDTFSGYDRCVGCTISLKDYYTRADNDLFNTDY